MKISKEVRDRIEAKRLAARRTFLNNKDLVSFDNVPAFIIDSFFQKSTYHKRMIVATFSYLNGLTFDQLLLLIHWNDYDVKDYKKLKDLYCKYFSQEEYRKKYFSYSIHTGLVMYLDGKIRRFGKRI